MYPFSPIYISCCWKEILVMTMAKIFVDRKILRNLKPNDWVD